MKKILFVDMHRAGRSPSQRFRYEQYVDLLKNNGFEVKHSYLISKRDDSFFYSSGNYLIKGWILIKSIAIRMRDCLRANQYDFIFIQREAFMLGTTLFEWLFSKSKATLIFDFDDSIWLNQISASAPNKSLNFLKNPAKTSRIIELANVVVAGNPYLADYARAFNKNVRVIPTTIDTELYAPEKKTHREIITIGWSGSKTTIDHFEEAIPALKIIKKKYGNRIHFEVIGDGSYQVAELGIQGKHWNLATEVDDLRRFDIGIMPLPADDWSKGKCGLKGLQYMALEIPTIMSPVGVNTEIIKDGQNGFLASSTEDWIVALEKLIEDESLRIEMGRKGRETVVTNYSVSSTSPSFLSLFE